MADFVGWVGDVLALEIATIGTVTVTLGLIAAASLIFGLALGVVRKIKGRG